MVNITVKEHSLILMVESMLGNSRIGNNMEKEFPLHEMVRDGIPSMTESLKKVIFMDKVN